MAPALCPPPTTAGRASAYLAALVQMGLQPNRLRVQTSVSLQHVPIDVNLETKLPADLRQRLAFAVQKLGEMVAVARTQLPAPGSHAAGQ